MAKVKTKDDIQKNVIAYNKVFDKSNQFTQTVLEDLADWCHANKSTFHSDARAHAVLEGRREVWLRIQEFLNLNVDELFQLRPKIKIEGKET